MKKSNKYFLITLLAFSPLMHASEQSAFWNKFSHFAYGFVGVLVGSFVAAKCIKTTTPITTPSSTPQVSLTEERANELFTKFYNDRVKEDINEFSQSGLGANMYPQLVEKGLIAPANTTTGRNANVMSFFISDVTCRLAKLEKQPSLVKKSPIKHKNNPNCSVILKEQFQAINAINKNN